MTTLLIDGDILAYRAAVVTETDIDMFDGEGLSKVTNTEAIKEFIDNRIAFYMEELEGTKALITLSDDKNWRKVVLPSYKENRKDVVKPDGLAVAKGYIQQEYNFKSKPWLEADDVMGILSTHPTLIPGEKIIVSEDKDMLTIPGLLYNPDKGFLNVISEDEADFFWMYQALIGDKTDGYSGCPQVGHIAALKNLIWCPSWDTVQSLYQEKGLGVGHALVQAQVARICRYTDYDFKNQEVIPWKPY